MNISKKEKQWLSILGIIAVGFLYYQFIYSYLDKAVTNKTAQEQEIKDKYNNAQAAIDKMGIQKYNVKVTNAKIANEAYAVYPTVSQEYVIQEIDKLLKENNLEGGMEFDLVELGTVDVMKKSDKDKGSLESTMQETVDKYNDKFGDKKDVEKNKTENNTSKESQATDKTKSNETSNTSDSKTQDNKDKNKQKENKIVKMKGKVKFYGTYENVVKFVKEIKAREKNKICLFGIGMEPNDFKWVKGELGIGIYSVPKLDINSDPELSNNISDYLRWNLNNAYGKTEPFQDNQAAGNTIKKEKLTSDFMISAKGTNSDLPTAMIGKSDDALRTTYLFADANDKQEAEIVLNKIGDKYYYKYKLDKSSMPVDYNGNGAKFTPLGDSIVIDIASEMRSGNEDKSSLNLNVINNTGITVKVEIKDDDKTNHRISIGGDNKNIIVSQK